MGFLDTVIKDSGNEFASIVSDGVAAGDITSYVDTGSYIFNALVSGSLFGGLPSNKVTALAGESSTGKTFFALSVVRNFLDANPTGGCIYFESESAISKEMIETRGIDSKRMIIMPVATIEDFRTQACRILDKYLKEPKEDRVPMMFVLDSLGMLSTSKEMEDVANDKQVRDMTKSQLIKGAFRVLTLKLGQAQVPMIVTNHTYDVIGSYVPTKEMGGGTGLKYAASTIIYLTKSKERDSKKEVVGNIIKCEAKKSRLTVEGSKVATRLFFDERGLDKYYGLLELGIEYGVFGKNGNRVTIGQSSVYPSAVLADPEKYFTPEVMEKLEEAAQKEFSYGN
jgi:RecA/RadA recombinase